MAYFHEENTAERALRQELTRRGLDFRQGEMIAGREIDFFIPRCLLAVEIDGFFHFTRDAKVRDRAKDRALADQGIQILRFGNQEVLADVRGCGDRVVDYLRSWERSVRRAGAGTGESSLRRGLRAWAAKSGFALPEGNQPPRRERA